MRNGTAGSTFEARTRAAVDELQRLIRERHPAAIFEIGRNPDEPENVHLYAMVDTDDLDEVLGAVIERVVALQVEEGIPVHVTPLDTLERQLSRPRGETSAATHRHRPVVSLVAHASRR